MSKELDEARAQSDAYKSVIGKSLDELQSITGLVNAGLHEHILHLVRFIEELKLIEVRDDGHVVWEHFQGVLDTLNASNVPDYKPPKDIFWERDKLLEEVYLLKKYGIME